MNRDKFGKLITTSSKTGKVINFSNALTYPLCTVPLSVANADGSKRKTTKSNLFGELIKNTQSDIHYYSEKLPNKENVSALVVDLMAGIRQISGIPETYNDLVWKYLETIPVGYQRVDIVADTYRVVC